MNTILVAKGPTFFQRGGGGGGIRLTRLCACVDCFESPLYIYTNGDRFSVSGLTRLISTFNP